MNEEVCRGRLPGILLPGNSRRAAFHSLPIGLPGVHLEHDLAERQANALSHIEAFVEAYEETHRDSLLGQKERGERGFCEGRFTTWDEVKRRNDLQSFSLPVAAGRACPAPTPGAAPGRRQKAIIRPTAVDGRFRTVLAYRFKRLRRVLL